MDRLEYDAAHRLKDVRTLQAWLESLRKSFPEADMDSSWLQGLLSRLTSYQLLIPLGTGAGTVRARKAPRVQSQRPMVQALLSPLAIRLPLCDPDRWLRGLRGVANALFHRWLVFAVMISAPILGLLVLNQVIERGFAFGGDLLSMKGEYWLALILCYLVAKSLHEIGHGLACVRHGVDCREMGLMLLCFAPCLYCDTTDSWKLTSKWSRAQIAAAGIYIEILLAVLAACTWLATRDGWVHEAASAMMIVCSIGTLMVNSNPLLRFDGYYVLSDVWGIPNLAERSREAVVEAMRRVFTGESTQDPDFSGKRFPLLVAFAVASAAYRMVVLVAILWLVWLTLVPRGFGLLAIAISGTVLGGWLWGQACWFWGICRLVLRTSGPKFLRLLSAFAICMVLAWFFFAVPLPSFVRARAVTHFKKKLPIYASQNALLVDFAERAQRIPQGHPLVELDEPALRLDLLAIEGEIRAAERRLGDLAKRASLDPLAAFEIPNLKERLGELRGKKSVMESEVAGLKILAPFDGYLLNAPGRNRPPLAGYLDDTLPSGWLEDSNLGCKVERSDLLGWFVHGKTLQLTAIVASESTRLLDVGMKARIRWDSDLSRSASGLVRRISPEPIQTTPLQLVGDGELHSHRDEHGDFRPSRPHYEVTIEIADTERSGTEPMLCLWGAPATVQIEVRPESLWGKLHEFFTRHFKPVY